MLFLLRFCCVCLVWVCCVYGSLDYWWCFIGFSCYLLRLVLLVLGLIWVCCFYCLLCVMLFCCFLVCFVCCFVFGVVCVCLFGCFLLLWSWLWCLFNSVVICLLFDILGFILLCLLVVLWLFVLSVCCLLPVRLFGFARLVFGLFIADLVWYWLFV